MQTPPTGDNGGPNARFLNHFPYLGDPFDGFDSPAQVAVNQAPATTVPGVTP